MTKCLGTGPSLAESQSPEVSSPCEESPLHPAPFTELTGSVASPVIRVPVFEEALPSARWFFTPSERFHRPDQDDGPTPSPVPIVQEDSTMDFRPLAEAERRHLLTALRGNADRGLALLLDRKDTSFLGTAEEVPDEQVITAVKSIPSHY